MNKEWDALDKRYGSKKTVTVKVQSAHKCTDGSTRSRYDCLGHELTAALLES